MKEKYFKTQSNISDRAFCESSELLKAVSYIWQKILTL